MGCNSTVLPCARMYSISSAEISQERKSWAKKRTENQEWNVVESTELKWIRFMVCRVCRTNIQKSHVCSGLSHSILLVFSHAHQFMNVNITQAITAPRDCWIHDPNVSRHFLWMQRANSGMNLMEKWLVNWPNKFNSTDCDRLWKSECFVPIRFPKSKCVKCVDTTQHRDKTEIYVRIIRNEKADDMRTYRKDILLWSMHAASEEKRN